MLTDNWVPEDRSISHVGNMGGGGEKNTPGYSYFMHSESLEINGSWSLELRFY